MGVNRSVFLEALREAEVSLLVSSAFSEDRVCEHSQHPYLAGLHAGTAEWYIQLECGTCGFSKGVTSVCTPWKDYASNGNPIICRGCRDVSTHTVIVLEPIKGGKTGVE